jgi:adenosine deaminase
MRRSADGGDVARDDDGAVTAGPRGRAAEGDVVRRLVEAMPKAELHLHLDGSVRPDTALVLARTRGIDAPRDYAGMFRALVAPARCGSQAELLRRFDLPISLLQDAEALARVTSELVAAKAAEGVRYMEIRWAPGLHVDRGLALRDGIEAVVEAGNAAADAAGVAVRFICTILRSHEPELNARVADEAGAFRDLGLTGFDLAGREEEFPDPLVHVAAFDVARAAGLRITIHAGEWGGADQVRRALLVRPERIAHGPRADGLDALCAELIARGVTLDLCPTSNVQAGIVGSVAEHPLARLYRRGVPVTLSTDDRTVSDTTLSEEYARAILEIGLTPAELWRIDLHALDAAFADGTTLASLRASFEAWAGAVPELTGDASADPAARP